MVTEIQFEWNERKGAENWKKHGVSFQEAQSVFLDDFALLTADPDHSEEEERFLLLGYSSGFRMLLVCHCVRQSGTVIRLISARKAEKDERKQYEERYKG